MNPAEANTAGRTVRHPRVTMPGAALIALVVGVATLISACAPASPAASGPAGTGTGTVGSAATGTAATGTASPTPAARFGVDTDMLLPDNILLARDGHQYRLSTDPISFIVRVPIGWLFGYTTAGPVTLLHTDGASVEMKGIEAPKISGEFFAGPAISADGQRLAWVSGNTLHAGVLTKNGLGNVVTSPTPADTFAQTWIGSRVVVGQSYGTGCCGHRPAQYDVWDPTKGNFVPHWTKGLWPVYGPVPAGVPAFAMVAEKSGSSNGCLARVDGVRDMSVTARACLPGLAYESLLGRLSPDGRHLAELGGSRLVMIDLSTLADSPLELGSCLADQPLVWQDNGTFIAQDSTKNAYVQCMPNVDGMSVDPHAKIDPDLLGKVKQPIAAFGV